MTRGVLVVLFAVTALIASACDYVQGDVYRYTVDYQPGMNYLSIWEGFYRRGARTCESNNTINTVVFEIEGVPDSPPPPGWSAAVLSDRRSCEWLINNYG